jgi:hypothetical protein
MKLIYEMNSPSGEVLINLPELGLIRWHKYVCDRTFHVTGEYEKFISSIEEDDKLLIIVNDNSNHIFPKRSYIQSFLISDLIE